MHRCDRRRLPAVGDVCQRRCGKRGCVSPGHAWMRTDRAGWRCTTGLACICLTNARAKGQAALPSPSITGLKLEPHGAMPRGIVTDASVCHAEPDRHSGAGHQKCWPAKPQIQFCTRTPSRAHASACSPVMSPFQRDCCRHPFGFMSSCYA